jgi:hypothetical protein
MLFPLYSFSQSSGTDSRCDGIKVPKNTKRMENKSRMWQVSLLIEKYDD